MELTGAVHLEHPAIGWDMLHFQTYPEQGAITMLQDILNSFHQVVTRTGRRPTNPGGRTSEERASREEIVVLVQNFSNSSDNIEPSPNAQDRIPSARITLEPGPHEVVPPGWW